MARLTLSHAVLLASTLSVIACAGEEERTTKTTMQPVSCAADADCGDVSGTCGDQGTCEDENGEEILVRVACPADDDDEESEVEEEVEEADDGGAEVEDEADAEDEEELDGCEDDDDEEEEVEE